MLEKYLTILDKIDNKNMSIKLEFPSGLEIFGFATENYYGGDWDYGSSWNYLVMGDHPFLVDTGRFDMGGKLVNMIESAGISKKDIEYIVVGHGHEDHDGGLYKAARIINRPVLAHSTYKKVINFYPELAPPGVNSSFPASCWHCFMPDFFPERNCLNYHKERIELDILDIKNGEKLGNNIEIYHVPGHSPDSIAIRIGEEAILVGDTVLPEITPFPMRESFFYQVKEILGPDYSSADSLYGLRAYIKSIKRLKEIGKKYRDALILPSHRLFHIDHWNEVDISVRVDELIQHHIDRCADILRIINKGPKNAAEIAKEHFPKKLLEGLGMIMAENEIYSHCELLRIAGDVYDLEDNKFTVAGTSNFEAFINSIGTNQKP